MASMSSSQSPSTPAAPSSGEDLFEWCSDEPPPAANPGLAGATSVAPWVILVADDDPEVLHISRLVLRELVFEGRGVEIHSAVSRQTTQDLLAAHPEAAVLLLDVVMDSEQAGLELVRHVRGELGNDLLRIILRTGQPGHAPETAIITDYDINDYRDKSELTAQKLVTSVVAALRAFRDITARKRSEEALRAAHDELEHRVQERTAELSAANERLREMDQMKSDFMASVAHELRTPLTSIRMLSELLHDDPRMKLDNRTRFLSVILSEADRLGRLINGLLDLAKLESGHAEWNLADIDLEPIVHTAATALSQQFNDKQCRLELDLPPGPWMVHADRDRLMQVLVNLLSNAVKFVAADAGCVIVTASLDGGEVCVRIADNGPGVAEEDRAAIFDRFCQGTHTGSEAKSKGTGLGLPISRQIMEHLGGALWLADTPTPGACFLFRLPMTIVRDD